jgi:putative peptidoglycan lipid II flippase
LFAAPYFDPPVLVLAWAVFIGGLLQLAIQLPALKKIAMLPRPSLNWRAAWADPGVRRILTLMGPALIGVSVSQISLLINTIFASYLKTGSVSWLYYADRLMEFPSGMLGVALGTILLPSLARYHASDNPVEYSRLLDWGLRLTLLLAAPSAVALAMLAVPLIATLFFHGAFSANDVLQTRNALLAYAIGLTGLILVKVLAPGFYARQNIKTPLRIALISLFATQVMNLAFIGWLEHAGLALSIGLAACLNATLLYRGLRKHGIYTPLAGWGIFSLKLAIAMVAMAGALWLGMGQEADWLKGSLLGRIIHLAWLVPLGAATYFATLWTLGFRLRDFKRRAAE